MGQKLNRLKMFLKLKTFYEDIKFKKMIFNCNCSKPSFLSKSIPVGR